MSKELLLGLIAARMAKFEQQRGGLSSWMRSESCPLEYRARSSGSYRSASICGWVELKLNKLKFALSAPPTGI